MQPLSGEIEGVFIDEVAVWGRTEKEHDERLSKIMNQAQKLRLKLNESKRQFGVREITYLGERLSEEGVQPDWEKTRAIEELPELKEKKDMQRALGLVNYRESLFQICPKIQDHYRTCWNQAQSGNGNHSMTKSGCGCKAV